ncbi:hypothetical protein H6P81_012868 [Aristolochia fimbriata]|uniref:tRNA pseudouridine(55) synthase n=1 Tax=Aristolochia fimbriata TaxID=158543 RepID=A0AAV7EF74_ARIFI|nr:hypothetical protein H6P81_012868 [Aristolochia fimbriata]
MAACRNLSSVCSKFTHFNRNPAFSRRLVSNYPTTPYPLYYELISSRPPTRSRISARRARKPGSEDPVTKPSESPSSDTPFEDWADGKIADKNASNSEEMDKSMRKYYRKREKRMYGSDTDDEGRHREDKYIELKPEVVELPTLHSREEELYFHDTFAFPWEKDKHYKMVYQLEKKYFPEHCLDKAFVDPAEDTASVKGNKKDTGTRDKKVKVAAKKEEKVDDEDKRLVFFEEENKGMDDTSSSKSGKLNVTEKKVEEFFKCLKKAPTSGEAVQGEPFFASRRTGLPPRWDGPYGTVVLVNKPKGWTSFTVCGKLRRLVKVQKVGHAGTLDPMATGLLIVCIGKATKLVDRYQAMTKGYSGVFRLGEATSTWDADSPVIQREPWEHIKDEDIRKASASFHGEIWQVPPMFSAIKVGGEKMYDKARRGETVELSPRRISIYKFDIERSLDDRQNLVFRVICSKGTYIRSLCADFGKALGSCAHLTALRRDSIGEFSADDAWDFQELQEQITKSYF